MSATHSLPARRSIRLPGADYTRIGRYFVTICAFERHCLFGRVLDAGVALSNIGEIAEGCWREIPRHFTNVSLDAFVVMPNHMHGIVIVEKDGHGIVVIEKDGHGIVIVEKDGHGNAVPLPHRAEAFQRPISGSVPTIVRSFKAAVTYSARKQLGRALRLWQSNYFERVLRNDKEYLAARRYILENPVNWQRDKLHP